MKNVKRSHYVFVTVLFILVIVGFLIIIPFVTPLLFGLLFAYVFHPVQRRLAKYLPPTISAVLICVVVILLIALPLFGIVNELTKDIQELYRESARLVRCDDVACPRSAVVQYLSPQDLSQVIGQALTLALGLLEDTLSRVVLGIPLFVVKSFIFLFVLFYAVRDGHQWIEVIKRLLPLDRGQTTEIVSKTDTMLSALVYGQIITALVQGAFAGLGFFLFGVSNAVFWGLLTVFTSMLPLVGGWVIWVPIGVAHVSDAVLSGDSTLLMKSIGFVLYSVVFISLSDNVVRLYAVSARGRVHPLIVLVGVFGGIALFGISGIILGPLLLSLLVVVIGMYLREVHA